MRHTMLVPINAIRIDRLPRQGQSYNKALQYAADMASGDCFPPIKLQDDNGLRICDGRHRIVASRICGRTHVFATWKDDTRPKEQTR